jgi:ribose 5-phosphate isomerase B
MKVAIGSDHGGFHLKENIRQFLNEKGISFQDYGVFNTDSADYPDISFRVAQALTAGECDRGIIICGTGIGVSIAANKIKGIRAALCHDIFSAQMAREHNDANILTMGERVIGTGPARMIVEKWLNTDFLGGRHACRVGKISALENRSDCNG